jgi:hypothetical protein
VRRLADRDGVHRAHAALRARRWSDRRSPQRARFVLAVGRRVSCGPARVSRQPLWPGGPALLYLVGVPVGAVAGIIVGVLVGRSADRKFVRKDLPKCDAFHGAPYARSVTSSA